MPQSDFKVYAKRANAALLLWLACRSLNLFLHFISEYQGLHKEAQLLLDGPCKSHGNSISGHLIDCQAARILANAKTFSLAYAAEKTVSTLVSDAWSTGKREFVSVVKLMGVLTTCIFTSAFLLHSIYVRIHQMKMNRKKYGESFYEAAGFYQMPVKVKNKDLQISQFDENEYLRAKMLMIDGSNKFD